MRRITSLYLGGPDAAMPDSLVLMAKKRVLCADNGFVGVFPEDSVLVETEPSEAMAREIYTDRVSRMRLADAAEAAEEAREQHRDQPLARGEEAGQLLGLEPAAPGGVAQLRVAVQLAGEAKNPKKASLEAVKQTKKQRRG